MRARHRKNGHRAARWGTVAAVAALALAGAAVAAPPATSAAPAVAQQLLPDGGFESGNGGWTPFSSPTLTRVSSPVRSGKQAMKVTATSPLYTLTGMTQNTAVASSAAGSAYTASCYVRPSRAGLEVRIRLLQYTQDFGSNLNLGTTVLAAVPASTWTKVTVTGTATADGRRIVPQVYASLQATSTGYLVYDDCSLTVAPMPGPSTTGVPTGTRLTVVDGPASAPAGTVWYNNTLKVTQDGTVLDGLDVRGLVRIEAKKVVIRNSRITGRYLSSSLSLVYVDGSKYSVTISDSELYAAEPSAWVNGVMGSGFTLERVNIHHVVDQVHVTGGNVTVRDSWLHDNLYYTSDPSRGGTPSHDDNVQVQQGSGISLVHNTMESTHNAAVQVTQDTGQVANLRIERNRISHGGCSLNLAQKTRGPLQGTTITGNVFTKTQTYAGCAMIIDTPSVPLLTVADNTWVDGAAAKVTPR